MSSQAHSEAFSTNQPLQAGPYPAVLPLSILLVWPKGRQQLTPAPCTSNPSLHS